MYNIRDYIVEQQNRKAAYYYSRILYGNVHYKLYFFTFTLCGVELKYSIT